MYSKFTPKVDTCQCICKGFNKVRVIKRFCNFFAIINRGANSAPRFIFYFIDKNIQFNSCFKITIRNTINREVQI